MNFIRKYLYLIILSATLVLGAVGVSLVADVPRPQRFSEEVAWPEFLVANADGSRWERVTIYDAGDGNCYVFLPSYAEFDRVTVTAGKGQSYALDGLELTRNINCGNFQLETPYAFTADGVHLGNLWFRRSKNMAAMYIDTDSGSLEGVLRDTFPEELVSARVYTAKGKLDLLEDYDTIKCRGYTSRLLNKKSYTFSLEKSTGLLGMGKSKKWTLVANGYDVTQLRNKMAYSIAQQITPRSGWAPDCAFTELYLNGEYAGLYLLCQKLDAGPDHMNLPQEDYYFEIFPSSRGLEGPMIFDFCVSRSAEIKFPKTCTEEQSAFVQTKVKELHKALVSEGDVSWQDYIDMDSWVRKYLLEEVLRNSDGGKTSAFFHYDTSEQKFYVGHCWDYDRILCEVSKEAWDFPNSMLVKRDWSYDVSWFGGLYRKEAFLNTVKEYYRQEFRSVVLEYIRDGAPELSQEIRGSIESEYLRWPELYDETDWESAVDEMITFLEKHIAFLDALWLEGEQFYEIEVAAERRNMYVSAGMTAEELPENPYKPDGIWYLEGTDIPFDVTKPITGNVRLSAFTASETPPPTEEVVEMPPPKSDFSTQDYITFLSIAFFMYALGCFVLVDIFQRRKDRKAANTHSRTKVSH